MDKQEKEMFDLGFAAFYAGHSLNFAMSKAWRDGWQHGFTCAMRQYEREKTIVARHEAVKRDS